MQSKSIVVVGGGLAAASLVEQVRKQDSEVPLTLIGEETDLPYERPPLSKEYLQGSKELAEFTVHDAAWYEEHKVQLMLGVRVLAVNRDTQTVQLDNGSSLGYGQLVLATGARARTEPRDEIEGLNLPGVRVLRTISEARELRETLTEGRRLAVLGSGWIGMEIAASARKRGAEVTILSPSATPLSSALGEEFGSYVAQLHRDQGVDLRMNTVVRSIQRTEDGLQLHTEDGQQFEADQVLVAIGAILNTDLARQAGLEVDSGVVVDARLRTSDPRILAIGDIAQAYNTTLRRQLRVEHWDNAIRQGKLAAQTLLGGEDEYDWYPFFFTDQFDLGMEYVGDRMQGDTEVIRGDRDSGKFIMFWLREGKISAAMNVNIWDVNDTLRKLIWLDIPAERLADVDVPLEDL